MSDLVIEIADSEIQARLQILFCDYADMTLKLAKGFTKIRKYSLTSPQKLSEQDIAIAAIHDALNDLSTQ